MITTLIVTALSPFVVADNQEQINVPAEIPAAVSYDWDSQMVENEEDLSTNVSYATYSPLNGTYIVDDWTLA